MHPGYTIELRFGTHYFGRGNLQSRDRIYVATIWCGCGWTNTSRDEAEVRAFVDVVEEARVHVQRERGDGFPKPRHCWRLEQMINDIQGGAFADEAIHLKRPSWMGAGWPGSTTE